MAGTRTDASGVPDPAATPAERQPPGPLLRRAVDGWLDHLDVERGVSPNTLESYRRDLARYLAYLQRQGVSDPATVTPRHVAEFVADVQQPAAGRGGLSVSSAARTLAAVRGFHRFLAREGRTPADPAESVPPPRPPSRLPKAISISQVERLLESASLGEPPVSLRDRALLEILYGAGARIGEAVGLAVDDVDLDGRSVRLFGKGRKERIVPLGRYACEAVGGYLVRARPDLAGRGRGTPALFLNQRGRPLSRQSGWAIIRTAAERAGLTGQVSPHTLRHSFATHLLDGGADIRVVQELLGHASVTTTQVYTMVTIHQLREVYAQAHPRAR